MTIDKSHFARAVEAWLPYPVYRLVGGPFDGETRKVALIETASGMIAPPLLQVAEPPAPPALGSPFETMAENAVVPIFTYRFVATNLAHNAGHYEFVS